MFCPKCSLQQSSDDLRFCPRCGFRLSAVKELIAREESDDDKTNAPDTSALPKQKDITTGAALMYAGSVVASLLGFIEPRWPPEMVLPQAYLILGFALAFVLTLFHPMLAALQKLFSGGASVAPRSSRRRDGVNLGALLMFLGTLKAMLLASYAAPGAGRRAWVAVALSTVVFLLLLILRPVLRALHKLLFKGEEQAETQATSDLTTRVNSPAHASALPPAQSIPANGFASARTDTAELVAPPSVAEETTRKLDNY